MNIRQAVVKCHLGQAGFAGKGCRLNQFQIFRHVDFRNAGAVCKGVLSDFRDSIRQIQRSQCRGGKCPVVNVQQSVRKCHVSQLGVGKSRGPDLSDSVRNGIGRALHCLRIDDQIFSVCGKQYAVRHRKRRVALCQRHLFQHGAAVEAGTVDRVNRCRNGDRSDHILGGKCAAAQCGNGVPVQLVRYRNGSFAAVILGNGGVVTVQRIGIIPAGQRFFAALIAG